MDARGDAHAVKRWGAGGWGMGRFWSFSRVPSGPRVGGGWTHGAMPTRLNDRVGVGRFWSFSRVRGGPRVGGGWTHGAMPPRLNDRVRAGGGWVGFGRLAACGAGRAWGWMDAWGDAHAVKRWACGRVGLTYGWARCRALQSAVQDEPDDCSDQQTDRDRDRQRDGDRQRVTAAADGDGIQFEPDRDRPQRCITVLRTFQF
ncbi:hypothetical protein K227x_51980 [Rubripirellula lacrimiformis]|uniref:Uncharacterized protein n=1 Tax=Rubripirellula lacrimiformis TaxID=1930273 RepID=A0A517NI19_9BACT|nr:hypothetical protein K227x_51980 [Rubripirellula lacrimiformis]